MPRVYQGASLLITRTLQQSDGSALAPSAIAGLAVELVQRGVVKATLTLGTDPEFRANDDDDGIELEYTNEITAALDEGLVTERYTGTVPAPTHTAESGVRTIIFKKASVTIAI